MVVNDKTLVLSCGSALETALRKLEDKFQNAEEPVEEMGKMLDDMTKLWRAIKEVDDRVAGLGDYEHHILATAVLLVIMILMVVGMVGWALYRGPLRVMARRAVDYQSAMREQIKVLNLLCLQQEQLASGMNLTEILLKEDRFSGPAYQSLRTCMDQIAEMVAVHSQHIHSLAPGLGRDVFGPLPPVPPSVPAPPSASSQTTSTPAPSLIRRDVRNGWGNFSDSSISPPDGNGSYVAPQQTGSSVGQPKKVKISLSSRK